jgi:hypothetical protein
MVTMLFGVIVFANWPFERGYVSLAMLGILKKSQELGAICFED